MTHVFHGKTLDPFQEEAISHVEKGFSVIVSAPTGSGKTLIAEYAIDLALRSNKVAIYTAPIKALSNQKYRDFCEEYGEDKIGIMTGDVVINPTASVLIMTTEVYRNMVISQDPFVKHVKFLVIDEVHFINDRERGTVWEESIIFSPSNVRFLCLSATIPNAREFADWIKSIHGHEIRVVEHHHRPVPLEHLFYDLELGITDLAGLQRAFEYTKYPSYERAMAPFMRGRRRGHGKRQRHVPPPIPRHEDLVRELVREGNIPCLYFVFSRARTEKMAKQLSRKMSLLSPEERAESGRLTRKILSKADPQIHTLNSMRLLRQCLINGIGFHHAGILPKQKELVEKLFTHGLVKVLYATETFAVGINMPAKVVCFDSLRKFDGISHRYLKTKEYYQLAGRAGRRGMDEKGLAIAVIQRQHLDLAKLKRLTTGDDEPLESQFRLSYNSILNMLLHHTDKDIEILLESNFSFFQQYRSRTIKQRTLTKLEYEKKKKTLQKLGYLEGSDLTDKGLFATHIYSNELLVSELFSGGFTDKLNEPQITLLVAAILYEENRKDKFKPLRRDRDVKILLSKLKQNPYAVKYLPARKIIKISRLVLNWYDGCHFNELLEFSNLLEGDLFRIFRQTIDLLMQINKATTDERLREKVFNCIRAIDREFITVSFD